MTLKDDDRNDGVKNNEKENHLVDIVGILEDLRKKRPIFHSEADFQHALAWEIHQKFPKIGIRLERRFDVEDLGNIYLDNY